MLRQTKRFWTKADRGGLMAVALHALDGVVRRAITEFFIVFPRSSSINQTRCARARLEL
jgi:hypothetical protein